MLADQRLAMLLALAAAAVVSAILAQTMTWRLRRLTRAASQYTRGRGTLDVAIGDKQTS